jgi:imidazolonepropionase-like amidohydrolase
MQPDFTPLSFEVKGRTSSSFTVDASRGSQPEATVKEDDVMRHLTLPPRYFVGFGSAPYSAQMMLLRYWMAHRRPLRLAIARASAAADDLEIRLAGRDSIRIEDKIADLTRYTIGNLVWGREVLWMDDRQQLVAAMTFAGGLPFEAIRDEYEPAFDQLFRSGVGEEMRTFDALGHLVPPEASGVFAIAGATLVDGTGHEPVPDSVVIVRDGRIAEVGPRSSVAISKDMTVIDGRGKTLLPGLWEMHTHFSGVEFGPALLAAGITTARDCGGEFEFLTAARDTIDQRHAPGPRLLLAGLVDASGPKAFGAVTADTPEEARAVVERYHAAGFEQIKLYTYLKPDIVVALAAEAHLLGMSVTGHVPQALNAFQGVEAGMDQINHLNYVSQMMRPQGSHDPIDLNSELARKAIEFFEAHHTVIDPTAGWGEMAGHSKDMEVAAFEPGIAKAPYVLVSKFLALGAPVSESARVHARMAENIAVIGALHKAGIPIVAGSDTGLPGYGLLREIEIYAQAGMTPLEAIQAATIVPARAMRLDRESGTVEAGKRADLILVDGNPLDRISDIRRVTKVVTNGRLYDAGKLWKSVGYRPGQ